MKVDLHTHTLASDGDLSPRDLVLRAAEHGVECLAVTDHDTCAGLAEAQAAADETGIQLVPGIELSTQWKGLGIHIVGLNFDPHHPVMLETTEYLSQARINRGKTIGIKLEKLGMSDVYAQAQLLADRAEVGRPHFARALVAMGHVKTEREAFEKYLGAGKTGDVKTEWPSIEQAIEWIKASGGVAVLAHPGKYKMTWAKLRALLDDFIAADGEAVEISYGSENPDRLATLTRMTHEKGLKASVGSDFHSPRFHWTEGGKYPQIKGSHTPVWEGWI